MKTLLVINLHPNKFSILMLKTFTVVLQHFVIAQFFMDKLENFIKLKPTTSWKVRNRQLSIFFSFQRFVRYICFVVKFFLLQFSATHLDTLFLILI